MEALPTAPAPCPCTVRIPTAACSPLHNPALALHSHLPPVDPMIPHVCTPAAAAAARVQERKEAHRALVDPQEAAMMVEVHAIHPTNQLPPLLSCMEWCCCAKCVATWLPDFTMVSMPVRAARVSFDAASSRTSSTKSALRTKPVPL